MSPLSEEQAAKLREYNRNKAKSFLGSVGKDFEGKYLKTRLRFWGVVLGLNGLLGAGVNFSFLASSLLKNS